MSQSTSPLLTNSLIEKLKAATSLEEFEEVKRMAMVTLENPPTQIPEEEIDLNRASEYSPEQIFNALKKKYAGLDGIQIGRSDAAEKYGTTHVTILRWEKSGLVQKFSEGFGRGNQVMVNERDVAVMSELNKLRRAGGNKSGPIKGWNKRPKKIS